MTERSYRMRPWTGSADLTGLDAQRWVKAFQGSDAQGPREADIELVAWPWRWRGHAILSLGRPTADDPSTVELHAEITGSGKLQRDLLPWRELLTGFFPWLWSQMWK